MRIAIAGPDGAGKSSVCRALAGRIGPAAVIYAGKDDFRLKTTAAALRLWERMRTKGLAVSVPAQYLLFYPLEYRENVRKFRPRPDKKEHFIFDRHPIDRMIMMYELRMKYRARMCGRARFLLEYPMRVLWNRLYRGRFPALARVYVLLPEPRLCFERSGGHYTTIEDARRKIEAYRIAANEWDPAHKMCVIIPVSPDMTVDDVAGRIVSDLGFSGQS